MKAEVELATIKERRGDAMTWHFEMEPERLLAAEFERLVAEEHSF
jgi:hypothetical protein